jgi:hypothetical protein
MQPLKPDFNRFKNKPAKSRFLHSPDHVLADELATKLRDPKHFGLYLKMATMHPHDYLRKLAAEVLEKQNVQSPAKLFSYLLKNK